MVNSSGTMVLRSGEEEAPSGEDTGEIDELSTTRQIVSPAPPTLEADILLAVERTVEDSAAGRDIEEAENDLAAVAVAVAVEIEPVAFADLESPRHDQNRAAFISVTVTKETRETKLGIALQESEGELEIYSISKECGLLLDSPLRAGDKVRSINNFRCSSWDPDKAMLRLKEIEGPLTIIVQNDGGDPNLVEAVVVKPSPDSKVGVGFMLMRETLAIGSINPEGLFANSVVNIGDQIISINSNPCSYLDDPVNAVTIVKNTLKNVTIVAQRQYQTGVVVSRHSFCSTTSSRRPQTPKLDDAATGHGKNKGIRIYTGCLIAAGIIATAVFAIFRGQQESEEDF
jgi:hypothetical protein